MHSSCFGFVVSAIWEMPYNFSTLNDALLEPNYDPGSCTHKNYLLYFQAYKAIIDYAIPNILDLHL